MAGYFGSSNHHHNNHHDDASREARLAMLSARAAQVAAHASHSEEATQMALVTLDELDKRIEDALRVSQAHTQRGDFYITGYYVQGGKKCHTGFIATFSGDDGCSISGSGRDAAGAFTVEGRRTDATRVAFAKHYAHHVVHYDGVISDSGDKLKGVWTIAGEASDAFKFHLERVDGHEEPIDVAKWKGHYYQFDQEFDTCFPLRIYASGRFDGHGEDDAGEFEIDGVFLDGSHSGPFVFTKKYSGHAIAYRGERDGSKMKGEYEGEACGRDKFKVKRKHSLD